MAPQLSITLICLILSILFLLGTEIAALRLQLYKLAKRMPGNSAWRLETTYSLRHIVAFRLHLLIEDAVANKSAPIILEQRLRKPVPGLTLLFAHATVKEQDPTLLESLDVWTQIKTVLKATVTTDLTKHYIMNVPRPSLKKYTVAEISILVRALIEALDHLTVEKVNLQSTFYKYPLQLSPKADLKAHVLSTRLYIGAFMSLAIFFFCSGFASLFFKQTMNQLFERLL